MAAPVITRVLPYGLTINDLAEGPTSGRTVIEIYGRNFRVPTYAPTGPQAPPVNGYVFAKVPKTVEVLFGGVEALDVQVISPIKIQCLTPITPISSDKSLGSGQGAVDVTVTNLDDSEDPIPGESVTLSDGFTYRHPKLDATNGSTLLRLVRELIQQIKKQVLPNVILTTHTDFDADTSTAVVEIAEMPALILQGPSLPENRFYSVNHKVEVEEGGIVRIRRKPRTVDLVFNIIGVSDSTMELFNLVSAMSDFVEKNPKISIDCDPNDPAAGRAEYEFDYADGGDLEVGDTQNISNTRQFTGIVTIRGFDLDVGSFAQDQVADLSVVNTEGLQLDVESFEG